MASSSSSERELQEELKDAGNRLLMPPSSIYELLSLLDKLEHLLSRVEQAPSRSMQDALLPVMKALVAQELLRHSDIDVKVSVACCVNEITRITAPDAPYDDERMKETFKLTVMSLENLSLASGRCYTKAVSILDTIAKVRSCLVMLDLECDELIIEMFQLFLNTIRSDHPHSIFSNMETIMTLVIDEIEEVPLELLIPLLTSVKKANQNVSPLSCKLGENVLKKCAAKLKPYLTQGVQFMGIDLNDFAEIISSICQDASGREHSVAKELAPDAVCPGGAGPSVDGSSRSVMNDGTAQRRGTYPLGDKDSVKTIEHCQCKSTDARSEASPDYLNSSKAVNPESEPESVPKKRGRKPNSLIKPEEGYEHSWVSGGKNALHLPHCSKNHEKKVGSSSKDSATKELAQSEPQKETKPHVLSPQAPHTENVSASPSQHHSFPDGSHHKTGRPKKKGNMMNQDGGMNFSSVLKGDGPQEKASESADATSMKKSEVTRDFKMKPERGLRKNAVASKIIVQKAPAPGSVVVKKEDVLPSDPEGSQEPSLQQTDGKRQTRGNTISGKHTTKASSGKKEVSLPATRSLNKDKSQLEESTKTKCKRKRTSLKEEVSEMPPDIGNYGEELIGCTIKVWWPLDQKFYEGAIYSFDPIGKKHRVLYADGDEEKLDLRKEHWELAGKNYLHEQGRETDVPSSDALSDMRKKKKAKTKSESSTKQENVLSSSRSGGASAGNSLVEGPKRSSKSTNGSTLDTLCTVEEAKGDTFEICNKLKDEGQKSDAKSRTATAKILKKSKADTFETCDKLKDEGQKSVAKSRTATAKILKKSKADTFETRDKLKDEGQKSDAKSRTTTAKILKKSKGDNTQSSKGESVRVVSEFHATDTAEQKNVPSP